MAEKVEIDLEVNSNIEPTIANLKALKKQLKETAAGSSEFNKISKQIRDMDDAIKDASKTSDDFLGYLENASGPLGILGKGIRQAEQTFSSFNAVLKASVIGLIVAAIGGLVAAFSKSETAMKKLQPLFIGLEKILGGIFRALEPLLDTFVELATKALPYVTKGIGIFYSSLVGLFTYIKEAGTGVAKIWKGIFTFDYKTIESGIGQIAGSFSKVGEAYKDSMKRFEEGTKEVTKTEKEELEERAKLAKEAADKKKARDEKALQEKQEREAEALREEQEILEGILKEYEARKKKREKENTKIILQDSLNLKVEAAKKEEEELAKRKKEFEDKIKFLGINTVDEQVAYMKTKGTPALITEIQKGQDAYKASKAAEKKFVELTEEDKLSIISDGIGAVASLVGESTIAGKALAVAQASIDTYAGANKALSAYPPPFGAIAAGTVIVAGLMNVRKILSTQLPKIPGARGSSSGPAPSMGSIPSISTPQIQTGQGINATQQIAQTIGASQKPIQAYVVSTQITSQQALDRRTNSAATFS
jgi:hypothetical protein